MDTHTSEWLFEAENIEDWDASWFYKTVFSFTRLIRSAYLL